jgi:hypothetical protein
MSALKPLRPLLVAFALLIATPAEAFTPPSGWILTETSRALRDISDPSKGEILIFTVTSGSSRFEDVAMLLQTRGLQVVASVPDGDAVGIRFSDRVGRARMKATPEGAVWAIVSANEAAAAALDPDAILLSVLPGGPAWGGASPAPAQPVPAAQDGAGWGGSATPAPAAQTWDVSGGAPRGPTPSVVGVWEATALVGSVPTRYRFRFNADGTVNVEKRGRGPVVEMTGHWAARPGHLRLGLAGGGDDLPMRSGGGNLGFEFDGVPLSLSPAR